MKTQFMSLEEEIALVKESITKVGHMHPGSLSVQNRTGDRKYYQLSYTHAGKGHTHYMRPASVNEVKEAVANYQKFRELTNCWIELELEFAKATRSVE